MPAAAEVDHGRAHGLTSPWTFCAARLSGAAIVRIAPAERPVRRAVAPDPASLERPVDENPVDADRSDDGDEWARGAADAAEAETTMGCGGPVWYPYLW